MLVHPPDYYLTEKRHYMRIMKKSTIPWSQFTVLKSKLNQVLGLALPYRCLISGEIIEGNTGLSPKAWAELTFISDPKCKICGVPFAFLDADEVNHNSTKCADCLEKEPVYDLALSTLVYNDASRPLILGYKHGDQTHMAVSFAHWMFKTGQDILAEADFLIPVPLHWSRLFKRRYNQSALLADEISKLSKKPVLKNLLKRVIATPPQGHMSSKERLKNVKHAFECGDKHEEILKGKTVILIDDVLTSGATANECAKVLKNKGCSKVYVLCLARVAHI